MSDLSYEYPIQGQGLHGHSERQGWTARLEQQALVVSSPLRPNQSLQCQGVGCLHKSSFKTKPMVENTGGEDLTHQAPQPY